MRAPCLIAFVIVPLLVPACDTIDPAPPPRSFVEGQRRGVSQKEIEAIIALAKKDLVATGRASQPIYSVHFERPNLAFVYHGQRPKHRSEVEEYLIVERVKGRWQMGEREVVRGVNIPTS